MSIEILLNDEYSIIYNSCVLLSSLIVVYFSSIVIFRLHVYIQYFNRSLFTIFSNKNEFNKKIIEYMGNLSFIPNFLLPHYLLQGAYLEYITPPKVMFKREYIINPNDNGIISLDWLLQTSYDEVEDLNLSDKNSTSMLNISEIPKKDSHKKSKKVLSMSKEKDLMIIVHGLSGGSETSYVRDIALTFANDNYLVVIIHARGINDTPLGTPIMFHAGFTEDLEYSIDYIRKYRKSITNAYLIGTSMGANTTYRLLRDNRKYDDFIKGYISVSNFFNMIKSSNTINKTLFDYFLVNSEIKYYYKHKDIFSSLTNKNIDFEKLVKSNSMQKFDSEFVVKMHDFKDLEDYYTQNGSYKNIDGIKQIKTMILVAEDDPVVSLSKVEIEKSKHNTLYTKYIIFI